MEHVSIDPIYVFNKDKYGNILFIAGPLYSRLSVWDVFMKYDKSFALSYEQASLHIKNLPPKQTLKIKKRKDNEKSN